MRLTPPPRSPLLISNFFVKLILSDPVLGRLSISLAVNVWNHRRWIHAQTGLLADRTSGSGTKWQPPRLPSMMIISSFFTLLLMLLISGAFEML